MNDAPSRGDKPQVWIDGAGEALRIAEQLLDSGRHLWAIFFCHLAIEKMLKAAVIEKTGELAPKTHNLRFLVGLAGLPTDGPHFEFISVLSDVSVPTRYPEDFGHSLTGYSQEVAKEYLTRAREAIDWIKTFVKP